MKFTVNEIRIDHFYLRNQFLYAYKFLLPFVNRRGRVNFPHCDTSTPPHASHGCSSNFSTHRCPSDNQLDSMGRERLQQDVCQCSDFERNMTIVWSLIYDHIYWIAFTTFITILGLYILLKWLWFFKFALFKLYHDNIRCERCVVHVASCLRIYTCSLLRPD